MSEVVIIVHKKLTLFVLEPHPHRVPILLKVDSETFSRHRLRSPYFVAAVCNNLVETVPEKLQIKCNKINLKAYLFEENKAIKSFNCW